MQYTQSELAKLIETVETEFSGYLAKSESAAVSVAPLAKAEDAPSEKKDEKSDKKDAKPEEKKDEKKDEAPKAEAKPEAKPEEKAPQAEEKPVEAKPEGQAESKEAAPVADESHGYDEEDMEHMYKMYASMSKAELKAHHDAIMKCGMMAQSEGAPQMAKSETQPTQAAQPTEIKVGTAPAQPETALLKSELDATKAENETLKKNLDGIKEFLTAVVKRVPQGKAITSLDVVAKSEPSQDAPQLDKSEISRKLSQKAADPTLAKSDREAINNYYLNGANLNTISHLLK